MYQQDVFFKRQSFCEISSWDFNPEFVNSCEPNQRQVVKKGFWGDLKDSELKSQDEHQQKCPLTEFNSESGKTHLYS